MADFSHNWAKNDTRYKHQLVKYVDSPNAVTLRLPDRKRPPTYFERPLPCHMPVSGIESGPQQLHARTTALIMILKTECLLILNGPVQFIVFYVTF